MVDRCVCHEMTFRELREVAAREGLGLEELSRRTGCGTTCAMCRPYIAVMLATGRVELPVMSEEECARALKGEGGGNGKGPER